MSEKLTLSQQSKQITKLRDKCKEKAGAQDAVKRETSFLAWRVKWSPLY